MACDGLDATWVDVTDAEMHLDWDRPHADNSNALVRWCLIWQARDPDGDDLQLIV